MRASYVTSRAQRNFRRGRIYRLILVSFGVAYKIRGSLAHRILQSHDLDSQRAHELDPPADAGIAREMAFDRRLFPVVSDRRHTLQHSLTEDEVSLTKNESVAAATTLAVAADLTGAKANGGKNSLLSDPPEEP